jgi:hypothetical protein
LQFYITTIPQPIIPKNTVNPQKRSSKFDRKRRVDNLFRFSNYTMLNLDWIRSYLCEFGE